MSQNNKFEDVIDFVLAHEGGYCNNCSDRGGETNYGISKRQYPELDIRSLTKERAKEIYKSDFWDKWRFSEINDIDICAKVFDLSVNMGQSAATKVTQNALAALGINVAIDGILGSATLSAINSCNKDSLLHELKSYAYQYYLNISMRDPTQSKFLAGWRARAYA